MQLSKPEFLGKYILLERIASGGMAEVYLAKTQGLANVSKFFAIKRILPKFSRESSFIEMFKEEAKIAINLDHQNVVSIIEFGEENGQFFLVMEFVEGKNLREILGKMQKNNKQKLSVEHIAYILNQCAAGLDFAHRCRDKSTDRPLNITHRDISPQNLMVNFEGSVKICDFGIAKAESKMETTQVGTLKGKYGYMSPEQVDGLELDYRTDIFSMGIVLWELLAHERLFYASNEINTLRKIQECDIKSLRKIDPTIPVELERITNKALAKDRSYRYQSAGELHRDLNRFLNQNYPDCSPQDVGNLISQLYLEEREELRKRMVEYATVHAIRTFADPDSEKTVVDAINDLTKTNPTHTALNTPSGSSGISLGLRGNQTGFTNNLLDLDKTDFNNGPSVVDSMVAAANKETKPVSFISPKTNLYGDQASNPGISKTKNSAKPKSSRPPTSSKVEMADNSRRTPPSQFSNPERSYNFDKTAPNWTDKFLSLFAMLSIAVAVLSVGLLYFKNHPDQLTAVEPIRPAIYAIMNSLGWHTPDQDNVPDLKQISMASTVPESVKLQTFVDSEPRQAEIYVDDIKTGLTTPASLNVKKNKSTKIMFVKSGTGLTTKTIIFHNDATNVKETIPSVEFGVVSVDVKLGTPNTELYIDNELIQNHSGSLDRYPVREGTHKIIARDNFEHTRAEQTIKVGPNSIQDVVLIMARSLLK